MRRGWLGVLAAIWMLILAGFQQAAPATTGPAPTASAGGTAKPAAAEKTTVKFAVNAPSFPYFIPYLAKETGLFEQEGLNVEFIQTSSGAQSPQLVIAGEAGYATADVSHVVTAQSKGQDLVAVAGIMQDMGLTYVVTNEFAQKRGIVVTTPIKDRFSKIKGAKIAVAGAGTTGELVIKEMVKAAGLNPTTNVEISFVSSATGREAAAQKGDLDIIQATTPYDASAVRKGIGKVILRSSDIPELKNVLGFVIIAREARVKANPETTRRFVRALARAEQMVQSDVGAAVKVAQKIWNTVDPAAVEDAVKQNVGVFPKTPKMDPAAGDNQVKWLVAQKLLSGFVPGEKYVRNDYAQ